MKSRKKLVLSLMALGFAVGAFYGISNIKETQQACALDAFENEGFCLIEVNDLGNQLVHEVSPKKLADDAGSDKYKLENLSLERGKNYQVAWVSSDWSINHEVTYSALNENTSDAYIYFKNNSAANAIRCVASGNYDLYFEDNGGSGNDKLRLNLHGEGRTSEQLVIKLLSYGENPEEGTCTDDDKYATCKEMYEKVIDKDTFISYAGIVDEKDAELKSGFDRYIAWTVANKDTKSYSWMTPEVVNAAMHSRYFDPDFENSFANISLLGSIIIIASVVAISGLALLGICLLKRKKHE